MLFGAAGQAASMAILAAATANAVGEQKTKYGIVAAVFLFVFNSFFAIGWLGMTWYVSRDSDLLCVVHEDIILTYHPRRLYPAEITPLAIRAPANSISTTANWIFNFMVVMVTPPAFASIGYNTYTVFACINAFMVPCVYLYVKTQLSCNFFSLPVN